MMSPPFSGLVHRVAIPQLSVAEVMVLHSYSQELSINSGFWRCPDFLAKDL